MRSRFNPNYNPMKQIATAIICFLDKNFKQHLTPEFKAFVVGVVYDFLKNEKESLQGESKFYSVKVHN